MSLLGEGPGLFKRFRSRELGTGIAPRLVGTQGVSRNATSGGAFARPHLELPLGEFSHDYPSLQFDVASFGS
jgi:hypothetical protein